MSTPDPFRPLTPAGDDTTSARVADLEKRVRRLENRVPVADVFTGAPSLDRPPGTVGVQSDTLRLWVYAAGGWHYTGLT